LLRLKNVHTVNFLKNTIRLTATNGDRVIPWAMNVMKKTGVDIESVLLHEPTLEDVYIKYTGKRLRDEPEGKRGQFRRSLTPRGRFRH
jgi:ABC-2 type transport system ATP-binding protein